MASVNTKIPKQVILGSNLGNSNLKVPIFIVNAWASLVVLRPGKLSEIAKVIGTAPQLVKTRDSSCMRPLVALFTMF
jgi:hypothetical protein